jgi:transposase
LTKFVTPAELRAAGKKRLVRHLRAAGGVPHVEALAERALAAAAEQTIAVPAERMSARLIKELAAEALATRTRVIGLDRELEDLLAHHPDAALIRSLPGMGAVLTAELIAAAGNLSRFRSADALAAAAGIAPVLRQSGKTRFLRRPAGGNKGLKRVFYQSAFCSLSHPDSRAFYDRKRREGKRHHQAVLALARRRLNVLWAMLNNRQTFQPNFKLAA